MEDSTMINQISYDLNGILQDCWHRMINGTTVKIIHSEALQLLQ